MKSVKVNAILNVAKTTCSIIFPLITTPYATRVLTAENYGKVSFSSSIISYFALASSLGIWTYVQREGPIVRDKKIKFQEFSSEIFTINVISTLFSYLAFFILLFLSKKLHNYTPLLLVQSLQLFLTLIGADWINQVYEDYFYITLRYIIMQCIGILCLFLFVRTKNDYIIYAFIMMMVSTGGNLFNIFYIRRYTKLHLTNIHKCVKHLKPIFKLFAVNIAATVYVSSDITILGYLVGDKETGIYQLTSKIYAIIKNLLSAFLIVAMPRLSFYLSHNQKEEYIELLRNIFNSAITIVFPALTGLFILSPKIILVLSTKDFLSGVLSLKILSFAALFSTGASIFSSGIILLYKQDNVYLIATFISSIMNIILNFILIPYFSYNGAAFTTMLSELTMMIICGYYSFKNYDIKTNYKHIFFDIRTLLSSVLSSIAVFFICLFILNLKLSIILTIIISICVSILAFYTIGMFLRNPLIISFTESLRIRLKKKST